MVGVDSLIPYVNNARVHSDEQVTQIASSIKEFGFNVPILIDKDQGIIAGHGRLMAAKKLGHKEVPCIRIEHLTETQKKAYILADNRIALNSEWNNELLSLELGSLDEDTRALLGFSDDELTAILGEGDEGESDNPYSQKTDVPTYEPTGEKPAIEELYDDLKAMDLIVSIQNSNLNDKEKQFLMTAASRHIVFDYAKIANFYAHSSKECQQLMEDSALVIIDFDKAIENGFVRLTEEINDIVEY